MLLRRPLSPSQLPPKLRGVSSSEFATPFNCKGDFMFRLLSASLLLAAATAASAQIPAPIVPEQIIYRHWPEHFVQWVGTELPYSMIELYVDPSTGATPLYDAVLTDRATGKRIHYTNQQQMAEIDKHWGGEAYVTAIALDRPASAATGATYLVRFVDHDGQPISWQFIQGSDISERGGGSSPAGTTPPILMYRQRSAVAGEGSAVKIGDKVSVAEVWSEISQPPYFVAYHGALTENMDLAVFAPSMLQWTTESGPQTLAAGAQWKLKSPDGLTRTFEVKSVSGDQASIVDHDDHFPGRYVTLDAAWSNGAWKISKMRYTAQNADDPNQGLTFSFTPAAQSGDSKFDVVAGRKTHIAGGTVHSDPEQGVVRWEFKDPQWLHGKTASVGNTAGERASR
jgi:hypothetical protein